MVPKGKTGEEHLSELLVAKWQHIPEHCRPGNMLSRYNTKRGANKIEAMICDFLKLSGHHCERTKTTGRMIEGQTIQRGFYGTVKTKSKWVPGTATTGSSDLKAIIDGRFIAIEVKYGKDRQSAPQAEYEAKIKASGGEYWIVKSFHDFYVQYLSFSRKYEKDR